MQSKDQSRQDEYLKGNIKNLIESANFKGYPRFSRFLDEHEFGIAEAAVKRSGFKNYMFFGGTNDCDRLMLGIFPDEYEPSEDYFPIVPLKLVFSDKSAEISHRDVLGSLMGLSIKRETVGDIIIKDGFSVCFVDSDIESFIKLNLTKIGRTGVEITEPSKEETVKALSFEEITGTVSSLRLDCVLSLIGNKSRNSASEIIKSGRVRVNSAETLNVSLNLKENDVISVRGMGKFVLLGDFRKTRKDRYFLRINKYI